MSTPYKYLKITDGIICLFPEKTPIDSQSCTIGNIENEPHILINGYAIPITYLDINDSTEAYTIYVAGSLLHEKELVMIKAIPLDQKSIGKLLLVKESQPEEQPI